MSRDTRLRRRNGDGTRVFAPVRFRFSECPRGDADAAPAKAVALPRLDEWAEREGLDRDAWLTRFAEKPSTLRSYRKEVERFLLWCAQELRKPLSSVSGPDCLKYHAFLQAVPGTWMQPAPMKSFDLPMSRMDIRRSFSEAEWGHVLACLDALPTGPERLRLKCILELLVTSGIRLDELAKARHKDLRLETLPDLPKTWILTVTGKRNKTREVPLNPEVVSLCCVRPWC